MADGHEAGGVSRPREGGITLIDLAIALARHKRLVLGLPVVCALIAGAASFLLPNIYTATARVLPPQQAQSMAAAMLSQLGALASVTGSGLSLKNPSDLYVGMLKSRSVVDAIIQRFELQRVYETETLVDTRRALERASRVSAGRDGIISIVVEDENAKRAADIANAYTEELGKLTERLALTEAAQRRAFFEKQLRREQDALAAAETEFKKTQERTGLIKLDEQGKAIIDAVASVRAQIAAMEVQISAMRSFATETNPQLVRAQQELAVLRAQLRKMMASDAVADDAFVPTGRVPEVGLEFARRYREVKYHETVFELLAKQYEIARLDEARDSAVVQVLDQAIPADKKSKPRRAAIALLALLSTGLAAIIGVVVAEVWGWAQPSQGSAGRWRALRRQVTGRAD